MMTIEVRLATLLQEVADVPLVELPRLRGLLMEAEAGLLLRLRKEGPQANSAGTTRLPKADEPLLTVEEALSLAPMPRRTFLRLTRGLPFRRDISRKTVLFERAGLLAWKRVKTGRWAA